MSSFFKQLGQYALGQVAGNLPAILTATGVGVGGLIDKTSIPGPFKTLIKGSTAAVLTVLAHNGSSPAAPSGSVVQQLLRPKAK